MKHESFWMWCAATSASLAMVAGAATAAFAQGRPVTVTGTRADAEYFSVLVSYRDLNLAVAADERRLKRRVNIATHEVCRPAGAYLDSSQNAVLSCIDFAWDGARPQIAQAVLRAREIAATGTSAIPAVAIAIIAPN